MYAVVDMSKKASRKKPYEENIADSQDNVLNDESDIVHLEQPSSIDRLTAEAACNQETSEDSQPVECMVAEDECPSPVPAAQLSCDDESQDSTEDNQVECLRIGLLCNAFINMFSHIKIPLYAVVDKSKKKSKRRTNISSNQVTVFSSNNPFSGPAYNQETVDFPKDENLASAVPIEESIHVQNARTYQYDEVVSLGLKVKCDWW